jgi:hypothetical protein
MVPTSFESPVLPPLVLRQLQVCRATNSLGIQAAARECTCVAAQAGQFAAVRERMINWAIERDRWPQRSTVWLALLMRCPSYHSMPYPDPAGRSSGQPSTQLEASTHRDRSDDWRLEALIERLPKRIRAAVRAMRQPSGRWLRIPAGLLLIIGGILAILPIFGLWMIPIGLILLADDVPLLRSWRSRMLDWVERRHPEWLESGSRSRDPS